MAHVTGKQEVIDCTFRSARRQSDILNEVEEKQVIDKNVEVPASITPEQIKSYCMQVVSSTSDQQKRRVYAEIYRIVEENEENKKKLREITLKELRHLKEQEEETPSDLQE